MDRSVEAFSKAVERNKAKLREVMSQARESIKLIFTLEDVQQVYQNLDNATVCKYLSLIQKA
jgi:hypothetical protein